MNRILTSLILGLGFITYGQSDEDIFNASKMYHEGSARFQAMGGAMGAMGADASAIQINPAANGRFSSSVFSISAGSNIPSATANFMNETTKTVQSKFTIPAINMVITKDLSARNTGDMYSQFAFGFNRISNFNQTMRISGQQFPSILESFMGQAVGIDPSNVYAMFPYSTALAYETYALDYDFNNNEYYSYLNSGDMAMNRIYNKSGGANEWYLNYSRNYMNKLYWGISGALRTYNFVQNFTHEEELTLTENTPFRGFEYEYNLKTKGSGLNFKAGFIYLVNDRLRFGASVHSPTFLTLKDTWSADMVTFFRDSTKTIDPQYKPAEGSNKYKLTTPVKVTGSVSYQIGTKATINADVDWVAYSMGRLKGTKDPGYVFIDFKEENKVAQEYLKSAINFGIGGEYNINQRYFIRAGFNYYGSAYVKEQKVDDRPDLGYSGGLGYKKGNVAIDLAYVSRSIRRTNYLFAGSNTADTRLNANQVVVTFNLYF